MNERNTIHSRMPFAMHESEADAHVYSSQTPAARSGDSRHESCHILVHTGEPMNGPFAALRPRGLSVCCESRCSLSLRVILNLGR
jgi:hypothetical protein